MKNLIIIITSFIGFFNSMAKSFIKKLIIAICIILFAGFVYGQEKFSVPEFTPEQKHNTILFQFWTMYSAGINFAKSQGISPYEYGKYLGNLFTHYWHAEAGFEGYMRGCLNNWESSRTVDERPLTIKENADGSVSVVYPKHAWKKYMPDDSPIASFEEITSGLRGIGETVANHMGCSFVMEIDKESVIWTIQKK